MGWSRVADNQSGNTGLAGRYATAVFELAADHPAFPMLRDNGLAAEGEMILRRMQGKEQV